MKNQLFSPTQTQKKVVRKLKQQSSPKKKITEDCYSIIQNNKSGSLSKQNYSYMNHLNYSNLHFKTDHSMNKRSNTESTAIQQEYQEESSVNTLPMIPKYHKVGNEESKVGMDNFKNTGNPSYSNPNLQSATSYYNQKVPQLNFSSVQGYSNYGNFNQTSAAEENRGYYNVESENIRLENEILRKNQLIQDLISSNYKDMNRKMGREYSSDAKRSNYEPKPQMPVYSRNQRPEEQVRYYMSNQQQPSSNQLISPDPSVETSSIYIHLQYRFKQLQLELEDRTKEIEELQRIKVEKSVQDLEIVKYKQILDDERKVCRDKERQFVEENKILRDKYQSCLLECQNLKKTIFDAETEINQLKSKKDDEKESKKNPKIRSMEFKLKNKVIDEDKFELLADTKLCTTIREIRTDILEAFEFDSFYFEIPSCVRLDEPARFYNNSFRMTVVSDEEFQNINCEKVQEIVSIASALLNIKTPDLIESVFANTRDFSVESLFGSPKFCSLMAKRLIENLKLDRTEENHLNGFISNFCKNEKYDSFSAFKINFSLLFDNQLIYTKDKSILLSKFNSILNSYFNSSTNDHSQMELNSIFKLSQFDPSDSGYVSYSELETILSDIIGLNETELNFMAFFFIYSSMLSAKCVSVIRTSYTPLQNYINKRIDYLYQQSGGGSARLSNDGVKNYKLTNLKQIMKKIQNSLIAKGIDFEELIKNELIELKSNGNSAIAVSPCHFFKAILPHVEYGLSKNETLLIQKHLLNIFMGLEIFDYQELVEIYKNSISDLTIMKALVIEDSRQDVNEVNATTVPEKNPYLESELSQSFEKRGLTIREFFFLIQLNLNSGKNGECFIHYKLLEQLLSKMKIYENKDNNLYSQLIEFLDENECVHVNLLMDSMALK